MIPLLLPLIHVTLAMDGNISTMFAAIALNRTNLPSGIQYVIGTVQKHAGNPLFVQDKPWEPRLDNGYPNVVYSPDDDLGAYRLWYGDCVKGCGTQILLFANSSDGLAWDKPELGLFDVGTVRPDLAHIGTKNNILLKGGGIGVYKDEHEKNASARYKAFGVGCFAKGGLSNCISGVSSSADGLVFNNPVPLPWPKPQRYDCHSNLFFDEASNKYVATTRDYTSETGRDIGVTFSVNETFHFSTKDAPPIVEQGTEDHQLYSQITFKFHDGVSRYLSHVVFTLIFTVFLGIVMVFDAKYASTIGFVHCRLVWSPDAIHWKWVDAGGLEGKDFIPLGTSGGAQGNAFDSHVCFAAARPVELDNEIRVYYMGGNGPHSGSRNSSFALATLGLDRYAGLAGSGTMTTRNITCTGAKLFVTVDILEEGGSVLIGGTTANGTSSLPGLTLSDAQPIVQNSTREVVSFTSGSDFTHYINTDVSLTVKLDNAILYAVGFSDA
eukprot:m.59923 g.59923  ORF g.59923 m.59923 type:complete len:495 (-) comp11280_c0_seq6:124-1608(-)